MNIPANIDPQNEELLPQIVEILSQDNLKRAVITFNGYSLRDQTLERLVEELPNFSHYALDVGEIQVDNLADIIENKLEEIIDSPNPEGFLVHILNLETSLLKEIYTGEATFIQELTENPNQLETTLDTNYLFWTNEYMVNRLNAEAVTFFDSVDETFSLVNSDPDSEDPFSQLTKLKNQLDTSDSESEKAALHLEIGLIFQKYRKSKQAIGIYEQLLANSPDAEISNAAKAALGISVATLGDFETATENLEEGINQLTESENKTYRSLLAQAHSTLGQVYFQSDNSESAIQQFHAASELYAEEEQFREAAIAQNQLAIIHEKKGNVEKNVSAYQQAAEYFRQEESPKLTARAYQQVGMIRQGRFQWDLALEAFRQALVEAQKTEDEFLIVSLEDSIEQLEERKSKSSSKTKTGKKKGFLGRLFG